MTRIKLALVIPTLDRSGAEKQFTLLATRLSQADFDVRVALLTRGGPFEQRLRDAGIAVEHIQKRWKADPWALKRLANWIRAEQPDVIHSWLFAAHAYVRLAVRSAQRPRIMISERCVDSWKSGWQHVLDRWLLPRTDLVVGNSAAVADYYHQRGVPREKLRVVYNGFDVAELPPTLSGGERNRRRAELLAELGFPPDAWVAGCIGRLASQKRVDDLIWAIETLRQVRPRLRGVIIGDGPLRLTLEKFARDVDCWDHVRFLGHQDDPWKWAPVFDCVWQASEFEGLSNTLMEAMARGIPVVASDIPPNAELITPGETGYLSPLGDRVGYMQLARQLMDSPQTAQRLATAASARIRDEFNVAQMVAGYATLYRELVRR